MLKRVSSISSSFSCAANAAAAADDDDDDDDDDDYDHYYNLLWKYINDKEEENIVLINEYKNKTCLVQLLSINGGWH